MLHQMSDGFCLNSKTSPARVLQIRFPLNEISTIFNTPAQKPNPARKNNWISRSTSQKSLPCSVPSPLPHQSRENRQIPSKASPQIKMCTHIYARARQSRRAHDIPREYSIYPDAANFFWHRESRARQSPRPVPYFIPVALLLLLLLLVCWARLSNARRRAALRHELAPGRACACVRRACSSVYGRGCTQGAMNISGGEGGTAQAAAGRGCLVALPPPPPPQSLLLRRSKPDSSV